VGAKAAADTAQEEPPAPIEDVRVVMILRLDVLLSRLRVDAPAILAAIDADPLLQKKVSGDLVLANASLELYTPQAEHQLYAKGIVYQRAPYRLISLPLIKIYNLGERGITSDDLVSILDEPDVRLRFLRKLDGSLIQVFAHGDRLWFTTRGMIEGARRGPGGDSESLSGFDFLGTARRLLQRQAPHLLADPALLGEHTLVFELLHPGAPHITQYGDREELVLLAALDRQRLAYLGYETLRPLGVRLGLPVVDFFEPVGTTLSEQIAGLLASLGGTDQEGSVLTFERAGDVIYRVKVKTPDYLRLLQAMALCSYEKTVAILEEVPGLETWEAFAAHLRTLGREVVPEEVLPYYRTHFDRYRAYLAVCEQLRAWGIERARVIAAGLDPSLSPGTPAHRKAFAAAVVGRPGMPLLFAALDGRLDLTATRRIARDLDEARDLLAQVQAQIS
jgi:hypothetical protein